MSKDTKHDRRRRRYRARLKEIKEETEIMIRLGGNGIEFRKEALKRLHKRMNRRGNQ